LRIDGVTQAAKYLAKLAAALIERFGDWSGDAPDAPSLTHMAARGTCRDYTDRSVAWDLLQCLCAVALASPSKSDLQQRDILIVSDPVLRARLDQIAGFDWLPEAPALVIFLGNHARFHAVHARVGLPVVNDHYDGLFNATVDASVTLSAFVTAAESVGLGCCPLSVLRNKADEVSALLGLPDRVFPVAGVALGWPESAPQISPRLGLEATVHIDRFATDPAKGLAEYDGRRGWSGRQRMSATLGQKDDYGWSDDKARQYQTEQRKDWAKHLACKKLSFD
jgi:nitroreductase